MVVKKSEYQNQFKPSVITKNQTTYLENLTFRNGRRDKEFVHTPIGWYSLSNEDVVSSDEETNEELNNCPSTSKSTTGVKVKENEPHYQSLAEILDASKAKSLAFRRQKKEPTHSKDSSEVPDIARISLDDEDDSSVQKRLLSKDKDFEDSDNASKIKPFKNSNEKGNEEACVEECSKKLKTRAHLRRKGNQRKTDPERVSTSTTLRASTALGMREHSHNVKSQSQEQGNNEVPALLIGTRPRRPDRQRRIPSAKCRPRSQERPPFVAYGAGDKENTMTTHRTHNVRSTVDVYGPALKAKIRREEEKKRHLQRQKRLAQSTNDLLERLANATPRDMIDYRSEYQKQFHGYEPREYERSCSSRAVIPHSAPIRAVNRGSSLIVHVD